MELPSIFDSRGVFKALPDDVIGTLDEAHATAYERIRQCAETLKATDDKLALATDAVRDGVKAVQDFEEWAAANVPKVTFMDLWRQTRKGS
jgi:hypothetical protein